jgi:hypothetical protein
MRTQEIRRFPFDLFGRARDPSLTGDDVECVEWHRDEIDVAYLDLVAFVLVTVVEALTHAAVLRRPDILSDEKAGRFVDDVTRLLVRYLRTS